MADTFLIAEATPDGTFYEWSGPSGAQEDVVLVHGVGLDHEMWDEQVPMLRQQYRVLRYDMLGHGRSQARTVRGIGSFVDQLDDLLGYLEIDRIHLVGLSMGGVVAQGFAGRFAERLRTLILMNTLYRRSEQELTGMRARLALTREQGLAPIAEAAIARWFNPEFQHLYPDRVQAVREKMLSNRIEPYIAAYAALVDADGEINDVLKRVACPTLVVTGEKDPGSTPAMARRMVADLPAGELAILEGLHHLTPVEAPGLVNQILLEFLSAHS